MTKVKELLGRILYGFTKIISKILDIIIYVIEVIVTATRSIARGFSALIGMGGCMLIFMFAGPYAMYLLLNPAVILVILFFIVFPILGTKFVSFLKYIKYMVTEFLYDRANYLMYGTSSKYASFSEYGTKYKRQEEAKRQKEHQEKQEREQNEWEEKFKQWNDYQNSQRNHGGYGGYGGYTGSSYTQTDPSVEFKKKYEESCDIIGVAYDADKYQIKLSYRQKAKEYHPDINKSPNATEMFQKINSAYDFLSDTNIERYQKMK